MTSNTNAPNVARSYKPVVQVSGEGEKWHDNAMRFATADEAQSSAMDLMMRWTAVTACKAAESDEPVNYVWRDGRAHFLNEAAYERGE